MVVSKEQTTRARGVFSALAVSLGLAVALAGPAAAEAALPPGVQVEEYVKGLQFPVKMAVAPSGDILVTEKLGAIRLIRDGELVAEPVASVRAKFQNEGGLLGIELTPDFEDSGEFIVVYTPRDDPEALYVSKFALDGTQAFAVADPWLTLPSRANTDRHYAGTLRFAPDGTLFISIGDLRVEAYSQDLDHLPGNVLRYNADLTIPDDNPFGPQSPIYAYGFRNPFGMHISQSGDVFIVENGGDVADELNLVRPGGNYGWPLVEGFCDNYPSHEPCDRADEFTDPLHEFRTIAGPTGVVHYEGEMLEALRDNLIVSGWHSRALHRFEWDAAGERLTPRGRLLASPIADAGFVDVVVAHDGALLALVSGQEAGHIFRIAATTQIRNPGKIVGNEAPSSGGCAASSAAAPSGGAPIVIALLWLGLGARARRRRA